MALRKYGTETRPEAEVEADPETLAALGVQEDEEPDERPEDEEPDGQ